MKKLEDFNLSSRAGRYKARLAGFDVPKMKPGIKGRGFWPQVRKTDGCWLWTGNTDRFGYGILRVDGVTKKTHRYVLELTAGVELTGKVVMHMCDEPACCNPAHLAVGTHQENMADKVAKNRQAKGSNSGSAMLTESQVLEMRAKYRPRKITYAVIAREYGVCKDTAQKAIRGINWGHI